MVYIKLCNVIVDGLRQVDNLILAYIIMLLVFVRFSMVSFLPIEWARTSRKWTGNIAITEFKRLYNALGQQATHVRIELEFGFDFNHRILLSGSVETHAQLTCYRCMKSKTCRIYSLIDTRLVSTEAEAQEIFGEFDAIVVPDGPMTIQDLVEDDLLLSIPTQICDEGVACSREMSPQTTKTGSTKYHPFKNIKQILS